MKYFLTEAERKKVYSSCFYEFQKGDWAEEKRIFWKEDSICIDDDNMYELELDSLIHSVVPEYAPFGETRINRLQWGEIVLKAAEIGGELLIAVNEADLWAREVFQEYDVFTILGL